MLGITHPQIDGPVRLQVAQVVQRGIGYGGSTEAPRQVGCGGPAGVKEQGKGTGGASQEPVRSP
jgi:hypothetical protein